MCTIIGVHCEECGRDGFDPLELTYCPDESRLICPFCASEKARQGSAPKVRPSARLLHIRNVTPAKYRAIPGNRFAVGSVDGLSSTHSDTRHDATRPNSAPTAV